MFHPTLCSSCIYGYCTHVYIHMLCIGRHVQKTPLVLEPHMTYPLRLLTPARSYQPPYNFSTVHLPPCQAGSPHIRKSTWSKRSCQALRWPLTGCSQWFAPAAMLSGGLMLLFRFSCSSFVLTPAQSDRIRSGQPARLWARTIGHCFWSL